MGRQLEMFPPPAPDANDRLNAAQAEMRLAAMERDASRPRPRGRAQHHRSVSRACPSCGACVTIRVS